MQRKSRSLPLTQDLFPGSISILKMEFCVQEHEMLHCEQTWCDTFLHRAAAGSEVAPNRPRPSNSKNRWSACRQKELKKQRNQSP